MVGQRNLAHGVMFHHFHNERHPRGQGSISSEEFEDILKFIGVHNVMSQQEWMVRLQRRELQDGDRCLTFDDALLCQFEIALPILEEHRLTAFWFVYSSVFEGRIGKLELYRFFRTKCFDNVDEFYDVFFQRVLESEFVEAAQRVVDEPTISQTLASFPFYSAEDVKFRLIRDRALSPAQYERLMDGLIDDYGLDVAAAASTLWMSDDHLRYLSERGHMIGLHSYSHPTALARLSPAEQADEYVRNFRHLQRVCRQDPAAMAPPTNS